MATDAPTAGPEETPVRVVLMTAPDQATAERLGRTVVEEGLAACANVVPGVTSVYRWQGAVHRDAEVVVILKTTAACGARLAGRLAELHPYDVPEVLALDIAGGHEPYLAWVRGETSLSAGGAGGQG